ncbi:MAG: protein translocase subunit SecF [Candidatus Nanopelagicales bacterium]|nr:protein translocase subunit SecF [Candidatus Nanopelagicales bacterium]
MSKIGDLGHRLYVGDVSYNFVGKRKLWYTISAVLLLITIGSLFVRGLNLGIEFRGGAEFQVPQSSCTIEQARDTVEKTGESQAIVTQLGSGSLRIQTGEVTPVKGEEIAAALADACGVHANDIQMQLIGPTWGADISRKALQALVVFVILVTIFLSIYFEWKMAVAALVALGHDLVITIGIYSILGFEVTPATAIGMLTILGYSLYDTVVVFDKVKENTRGISGQSRMTYSEAANLAVNQTLVRSINTSIVALVPVAAILFVGAGLLGAGTLKDLALALFVGMAAGAYSSIFVATPLLAQLKEQDPDMQALARRVAARGKRDAEALTSPRPTAGAATAKAQVSAPVARAGESGVTETGTRAQPRKQSRAKRRKRR